MKLGIRKPQDGDGNVANFQQIAQSFWKTPQTSQSADKKALAGSGKVSYVGGSFEGTFTNKEIENEQEPANTDPTPEEPPLKITYERFFD